MLLSVIMVAVIQFGGVCSAPPPSTEMVMLEVELGATAIFPCNGSAYLGEGEGPGEEEEEGGEGRLFLWEAMGREVAAFKDGAMVEGPRYEGRVRFAPEDGVRKGNWSLVLEGVNHHDANMYECIVPGRRTLTNVWLSTGPPSAEETLWVNAWLGDSSYLTCQAPEAELSEDLHFWWEQDGVAVPRSEEDEERIHVEMDGNHVGLVISRVLVRDRGVYRCFYKTSSSPEPRPGSPQIVRLSVFGSEPIENETAVTENNSLGTVTTAVTENNSLGTVTTATSVWAVTQTEEVDTSSVWAVTQIEEEVDTWARVADDASPPDPTPPSSDETPGRQDSIQWDNLPWVRISLIAGVLAVTGITLCILGARHMI